MRRLWAHLSCRYSYSGNLYGLQVSADTKDALFLFVAWLRSETKANGMTAPTTSTTLLRDIASSAENARWGEFFSRYEPMMKSYLIAQFPSVDADDVVQNTLAALSSVLPKYHYNPALNGSFHNYLTGIVRRKALDYLRAEERVERIKERAANNQATEGGKDDADDLRRTIYKIALRQFIDDGSIAGTTKRAFVRVCIDGEDREKVAESMGVSVNAVTCSIRRAKDWLRECVKELEDV